MDGETEKLTSKPLRILQNLTHQDWVAAAKQRLIHNGIAGVNLRGLAKDLKVTTGAFYWLFQNMEELFEQIRQDWLVNNTQIFEKAIVLAGSDGWQQYLAYVRVLVLDNGYDPHYDNAIRDWAHSSVKTADLLRRAEAERIEQLRHIFLRLGFEGKAALIRARVTYFSQAGYHALGIQETIEERLLNIPYYAEILTDRLDLRRLASGEEVRQMLYGNLAP